MTTMGDVLTPIGRPERISRPAEERFVTVKVRCGGAVERRISDGKVPVPFTGYRVRSGQFIYSRIDARNGAFAFVPSDLDGAVVSKDFPIFTYRSDLVEKSYLWHYLRAGILQSQIQSRSFGATNRQRLEESALLALDLPLPPLDEQRRIAAILDQVDDVSGLMRRRQIYLRALIASTFRSRFANSGTKVPIGSFARVRSGSTPSRSEPENYGTGTPWVKTAEVSGGLITQTEESVTDRGIATARLRTFSEGSVIVAMYGQGKTRGQSAILGIPATTNQACAVIEPNGKFDPTFLQIQLDVEYDRLRAAAEGGNQANLSVGKVSDFEVLLPEVAAQLDFSMWARSVQQQSAVALREEGHASTLFASLQARAFRGEL